MPGNAPPSSRPSDWLGLSGSTCAVTGAAGGIGIEIARQFAQAGARVALLDRNQETLRAVAATLAGEGATVLPVACDVTDPASVQAAAARVQEAWGPTRVLVNNAAALYADAVMDIGLERWNQLLAVNLSGYLLCAQAFGRQMLAAGGGAMVHVSSIAAHVPQPYSGAYSVSKAGVAMLSRQLALELGSQGVRSNLVSPAMIQTPLSESIYRDPQVRAQRERMVPAGRISTPADIAQAALFLASERASYINGQDILVDGGLTQTLLALIPRPGFEKADAQASAAASTPASPSPR